MSIIRLALLPLLIVTTMTQAQQQFPTQEVVITASGRQQAVEDVVAAVELIGREQLQQFEGASIADILRFSTGVQSFSSGSTDRIGLRGFSSNQTLVLVDGQRRASRFGGQNLAAIPAEDIERIEIIRGPKSALYGSEALGGVVNVILRRPEAVNEFDSRVSTGIATNGGRETMQVAAGWGTMTQSGSHRVSVELKDRQPLERGADGADVYNDQNLLALAYRGDWRDDQGTVIGWRFEYQDQDDAGMRVLPGRGAIPAQLYDGIEQDKRLFGALDFTGKVASAVDYQFSLARSQTDGAAQRQPALIEETEYSIDQADLRLGSDWQNHRITLGLGTLREDIDLTINIDRAQRESRYALLQDEWQITDDLSLLASVRYDNYSDFGSTTNPRVGLMWVIDGWRLRINEGRAFRAPDSTEQYSSFVRGTSLITGNPDLGPEKARMTEIAVQRNFGQTNISVDMFNSHVDGLINTLNTGRTQGRLSVLTRENIDRARLKGVELKIGQSMTEHLQLEIGYDYLDAINRNTGERLLGRITHRASLGLTYNDGPWRAGLRGQRIVDFYNRASPALRAFDENHARLDIHGSYSVNSLWSVFGGIDNITDRPDPEAAALQLTSDPGRRYYYVGIRFHGDAQ